MKEFLTLFEFLSGRRYSAGDEGVATPQHRTSRRKSSIVVNRFFAETVRLEQRRRSRCAVCLMLVGVVSIGLGCLLIFGNPYEKIFNMKVRLTEGGETYELWRELPVDLYLKVYLFNITNKDAFLSGKETLRVEEVGPYVYREYMEHANVTFNDNGTMTMRPRHPLEWVPELSNGTEDDILMLPNIALLSIANVVKDASLFTRLGVNLLIKQSDSHPLVETSAREFMFGYESPLTTLGNMYLPSWIVFDKIGLVDRMYDFEGDVSTVFTGETDVRMSGLFDTYRGSKFLPQWNKGEECEGVSSVYGASDASKFQSLLRENDTVSMYRKSLCRVMPMRKTGETVIGGLRAFNYTWHENVLDNGRQNPDNKCFCRGEECMPEGLLDVADCYYGFPIALSLPHFYKTNESVYDCVEGMRPDEAKHATQFVIQPETGLPLSVAVRMQINMAFGDLSRISRADRFSHMVLPMMWTEISMKELPTHLQRKFYMYLNVIPVVLDVAVYVLLIGGLLFLVCSVLRVFRKSWEDSEDEVEKRCTIKDNEMDVYNSQLAPYLEECETQSMIKRKEGEEEAVR